MSKDKATKFTREVLLNSKEFADVQPDFLRAILKDDFYTMAEAKSAIDSFFGRNKSTDTEKEVK